jgi:hypothetical protein
MFYFILYITYMLFQIEGNLVSLPYVIMTMKMVKALTGR